MASGAAGLRVAVAIMVVFAMLLMSSQGHPRNKPLCSDCPSLCYKNCSAVVAAECNSTCSPPVEACENCKSQVLRYCCQEFCSTSNDTSSISCCPIDCISGNCTTCSCDYCTTTVLFERCSWPCSMHTSDIARCYACQNAVSQQCNTSCTSACNDHCVKKDS